MYEYFKIRNLTNELENKNNLLNVTTEIAVLVGGGSYEHIGFIVAGVNAGVHASPITVEVVVF